MTYEEAQEGLSRVKDRIRAHKIGNDMYYSSLQYREDKEDLRYWENQVKELEDLKNEEQV